MIKKIFILKLLFITSCAKYNFTSQALNTNTDNSSLSTPIPSPNVPSSPTNKMEPLAWEKTVSGSSQWSLSIYRIIQTEEPQMLGDNVADDVETFCPKYRSLDDSKKLNFWGQLFAAVAKFESGWKPTSRMIETTMGTDPITGRQVASEGLLQLSYQDEHSYGLDCGFDWNIDKKYTDSDSRKTIFSPTNNLRCGIKIMARQLKNRRAITLSSGVYWAVLKVNGRYTKINEIAAITKTLTFCK